MLDTQFEIDWVSSFTSMGRQLKKKKKKLNGTKWRARTFDPDLVVSDAE